MNYLKKFNESKKEYYWAVDHDDVLEKQNNVIDISQEAINIINKFNIQGEIRIITGEEDIFHCPMFTPNNYKIRYIREYKDEWFIISIASLGLRYYLCDQLEGLERCLRSIVEGKINESIEFNSSEEFYRKLESHEFTKLIQDPTLSISDKATELIKQFSKEVSFSKRISNFIQFNKNIRIRVKLSYTIALWFYELSDEWFLVTYAEDIHGKNHKNLKIYLCDQLSGLKKFIDDCSSGILDLSSN